jgi:hypothetical protein
MFASGNEELVLTRLETFRMGSCSKLAKINGSRRTPVSRRKFRRLGQATRDG